MTTRCLAQEDDEVFEQRRAVAQDGYEKLLNSQLEAQEKVSKRAVRVIQISAIVSFATVLTIWVRLIVLLFRHNRWSEFNLKLADLFILILIIGLASIICVVLKKISLVPWFVVAVAGVWIGEAVYWTLRAGRPDLFINWLTANLWTSTWTAIFVICGVVSLFALIQFKSPENVVAKDLAKEKQKYLLR